MDPTWLLRSTILCCYCITIDERFFVVAFVIIEKCFHLLFRWVSVSRILKWNLNLFFLIFKFFFCKILAFFL